MPVARLVTEGGKQDRKPGLFKYHLPDSFFDALPDEELDAWQQ